MLRFISSKGEPSEEGFCVSWIFEDNITYNSWKGISSQTDLIRLSLETSMLNEVKYPYQNAGEHSVEIKYASVWFELTWIAHFDWKLLECRCGKNNGPENWVLKMLLTKLLVQGTCSLWGLSSLWASVMSGWSSSPQSRPMLSTWWLWAWWHLDVQVCILRA